MPNSFNCKEPNVAFIGLGSNQDQPSRQIEKAISHITTLPTTTILTISNLFVSKPYGYLQQDDFINAVIKIQTNTSCLELLTQLQEIEKKQNRVKTIHWGPRTIDLDILAYNDDIIDTENLKVPHPDLHNRTFVINPWYEIEPNWLLPNGVTISSLYKSLNGL